MPIVIKPPYREARLANGLMMAALLAFAGAPVVIGLAIGAARQLGGGMNDLLLMLALLLAAYLLLLVIGGGGALWSRRIHRQYPTLPGRLAKRLRVAVVGLLSLVPLAWLCLTLLARIPARPG